MTDLHKAAQQALEALEMSRRFVYADNRPQCDGAVAALRAALAQQDEPCPNCASLEAQNTELDRKLAELEQAYEAGYKAGEANEREECAKACEHQPYWVACAAAIRTRETP